MGIQGILPLVKPVIQDKKISAFRGKRVAVDGYSWLHKAAFGCCTELCRGIENDSWIQYCLTYIDLLLDQNITVFLVLDVGFACKISALSWVVVIF